jgi:capsule polysaccharide export protein KpsE/RkpR
MTLLNIQDFFKNPRQIYRFIGINLDKRIKMSLSYYEKCVHFIFSLILQVIVSTTGLAATIFCAELVNQSNSFLKITESANGCGKWD